MSWTDDPEQSERFTVMIQALAANFRVEADTPMFMGYEMALGDLSIEEITEAVKTACRECQFMPSGAELRKMAAGDSGSSWASAMLQVSKAAKIAFYQPEKARSLLDERTLAAVNAIGWDRLHDLDGENRGTFTAQFKNAYDALERDEAKIRLRVGADASKRDTDEARAIGGLAGRLGVTQ